MSHIDPVPTGVRRLRSGPVRVHHVRLRTGVSTAPHVHERWGVAVPLRGRLAQVERSGRSGVVPGEALGIEPGRAHRNEPGRTGCVHVLVELEPQGEAAGPLLTRMAPGARPVEPGTVELARRLEARDDPPDDLPVVEELALLLFAAFVEAEEPSGASPAWVATVRDRVLDDPLDPPDLDELAGIADVHPSTVLRAFRRRYGVTPAELNRCWRLEEAARRLRRHEETLAGIAVSLGFTDQSHLTRLFGRRFGVTPGRYRAAGGLPVRSGRCTAGDDAVL